MLLTWLVTSPKKSVHFLGHHSRKYKKATKETSHQEKKPPREKNTKEIKSPQGNKKPPRQKATKEIKSHQEKKAPIKLKKTATKGKKATNKMSIKPPRKKATKKNKKNIIISAKEIKSHQGKKPPIKYSKQKNTPRNKNHQEKKKQKRAAKENTCVKCVHWVRLMGPVHRISLLRGPDQKVQSKVDSFSILFHQRSLHLAGFRTPAKNRPFCCLVSGKQLEPQKSKTAKRGANSGEVQKPDPFPTWDSKEVF